MSRPLVLIIGGSFAGETAALELKRRLRDKVPVFSKLFNEASLGTVCF